MKFWRVDVKFTKIAIPDVVLFSERVLATNYIEQMKNNKNVVWARLIGEFEIKI